MSYQNDIVACNAIAQCNAAGLTRAALFALATIQQSLEMVPGIVTDFTVNGTASRFAWGSKKGGVQYLHDNAVALYRDAIAARDNAPDLMRVFLRVPGLGLVKSGFLCSLFAGTVGCIDSHNIKLYGVKASALRYTAKAKQCTRDRKVNQYIELCAGLGGAVNLWGRWCSHVAGLRPANWENGDAVSAFHCDIMSGREDGTISDLFTGVTDTPDFLQVA